MNRQCVSIKSVGVINTVTLIGDGGVEFIPCPLEYEMSRAVAEKLKADIEKYGNAKTTLFIIIDSLTADEREDAL